MKVRFDLFFEADTKDFVKLLSEIKSAQNDVWTSKILSELLDDLRKQIESALIAYTDKTEKKGGK